MENNKNTTPQGQPQSRNKRPRQQSQNGRRSNQRPQGRQQAPQQERKSGVSRGAAVRAQKRTQMDAQRIANQFMPAQVDEDVKRRANFIDESPRLKIIGLGGMDGGGSKNMMLV